MPQDFMTDDTTPGFDDFANQLFEQGVQVSPAQLHGSICAVLVGSREREADHYLAAISRALAIDIRGELAESSLQLIMASERTMADANFEFHLFLPDDDDDIGMRVQALADWCDGFIATYPLALAVPEGASLAAEVVEILKDIAIISEVGFSDETEAEEAEKSFFEIGDYLRLAVLNLYLDDAFQRGSEG